MLIIFGGLPGTGKTTIASALAERLEAVYLRIDSIEQAIRTSAFRPAEADIGPEGYFVACELAADNLRMGRIVIADSVNPVSLTRKAYRAVAETEKVGFLEVEVICSDKTEHQKRIDTRKSDIPGFVLPTWQSVVAREYENWDRHHLVLDTSSATAQECVEEILRSLPPRALISLAPACHLTPSDDRNIEAWRRRSLCRGGTARPWGVLFISYYNQRENSRERRRSQYPAGRSRRHSRL